MDSEVVGAYTKAGEIAKTVREYAVSLAKPGALLINIAVAVDAKIAELGAVPAFPVNLSLNEVAAHFTPDSSCEEVATGLFTIDLGVAVEGYIADTAITLDLTPEGEYTDLISCNAALLDSVVSSITPESLVRDVGDTEQKTLSQWNTDHSSSFSLIRSLSGHELGRDVIHAGLTISNYPNDNATALLGKAVAIEPFVTPGVGDIYEGKPGGIYILKHEGQVRDRDARTLISYIKEHYKTRPFCSRWLEAAGHSKLRFLLSSLEKQGVLYQYPQLVEKSSAVVSQMEHTFVFLDDGVRVTTL